MNRPLLILALLLAAIYAAYFTDLFKSRKIQIMYRSLPDPRNQDTNAVDAGTFYFRDKIAVKSIKVFSVPDAATNAHPRYLWNLVAMSNAIPLTDFAYGASIPGMKPFVPMQKPEPLLPRTLYHLLVEGDRLRAERDFQPRAGGR